MKKILVLLCLSVMTLPVMAESRIIKTYSPVSNSSGYYNTQNYGISDYSYNKLGEMESYLFGKTYAGQNIVSRIERLEDAVFNRFYPDSSPEQRIASLAYNYNRNNNITNTQQQSQGSKFKSVMRGISNSILGVPTGYTPPVYGDPYYSWGNNGFGQHYGNYSDYYGSNGWHRYGRGINSGSGVHIID